MNNKINLTASTSIIFHVHLLDDKKIAEHSFVMNLHCTTKS